MENKKADKKPGIQEPVVEIKEVGWLNDGTTPVKYQGVVTIVRPNGDTKVLTGDPCSMEEAALESLANEVMLRHEDIVKIESALDKFNL